MSSIPAMPEANLLRETTSGSRDPPNRTDGRCGLLHHADRRCHDVINYEQTADVIGGAAHWIWACGLTAVGRAGYLPTRFAAMDIAEIVQRQVDAYNAHDLDRFVATYADSIRIFRMPSTEPAISGKAQLIEAAKLKLGEA